MIKKFKDLIFFPWCLIKKFINVKKIRKKLYLKELWEIYKTRVVKVDRLNLNQTRHLDGRSLLVEIFINKWYRFWIPFYIRWEFYTEPFRVVFRLVKNYLKSLWKWWKLELEVYVFHLEEVKKLKKLLRGFWNFYFFILVGLLYLIIYGLSTIYLIPLGWKLISCIASESYIHNLRGVTNVVSFFFHIGLIVFCWERVGSLVSKKKSSEDVTEKIRRLDIFDEYDPNGFYKKADRSFGPALSQGGLNLSKEEKSHSKNRLTESWKIEWMGIEPATYQILKLGEKLNYSDLVSIKEKESGLKLKDLYHWKYLEKFLEHGRKLEGESLEEIYEKWEKGFKKIEKLVDYEKLSIKEIPEIKLERGAEEADVIEPMYRYSIDMPDEEELDFQIFPLEPEMDLYGFSDDHDDKDMIHPGSDFHDDYELEGDFLNLFPEELPSWARLLSPIPAAEKIVEGKKGGVSDLYKNLENMVFRRADLIRSDMVSSDRKEEGLSTDWFGVMDFIEGLPPIVYDLPGLNDLFGPVPIHEEYNLEAGSHDRSLPKNPNLLIGLAEEYDREIVLIDEIYQRAEKEKGKTLVEMELSYLNTEEIVPWSKVLSGLDSWFDEGYEIYFARAGFKTAELFGTDEYWEEEELDDETTLLVEEEDLTLEEGDEQDLSDYVAIAVAVFSYVWIQSFASIGYMPVREIRKLKNKEEKDIYYITKGLEYVSGKLRRRKRMVFTRRYIRELRQNQGLKEEEDLAHAIPYDSEAFFYVECYDRYDMPMELDYGHVVGTSHLTERRRDESFGMEMDSGVEGFYQIIDFSYTFWGTGWRLIQLGIMFLFGLLLTFIDWSTGIILSLGTWYLDYWWPFLSTILLSFFRLLGEAMTVFGSIVGYTWDWFVWILKGYEEGVLRERATFIVRAPWGYEYNGKFEDFSFHKILLDYWKTYPFSFGNFDIRVFFWSYFEKFDIPTKFFVMHGRNLTGLGILVDECLIILDLLVKIFDGVFVYSWCMLGVVIKTICYFLVFSIKLLGISLHYILTGLLKLVAFLICIF